MHSVHKGLEIPIWKESAGLIIQEHVISPCLRLCVDYGFFVIYYISFTISVIS